MSFRSCLTAGVGVAAAAAIAFVPAVNEPVPVAASPQAVHIASPSVKLTAQVQPSVATTALPNLLVGWLQRIIVPPSAGQPFPTPQFPPVVGGTSTGSTIKNVYNAVEPWVRYGFDLAAYAVGWVPYVGWLAPQITIFYNFGERIARSITFNIADVIDGHISFGQGLVNVGIDTINSFIFLANDQLAFWLPPLPPIPPIGPFAAAAQPLTAARVTTDVTTQSVKGQQAPKVVAVNEPKTTTSSSTGVAARGGVRGALREQATESTKVSNADKKGPKGPTADAATTSSTDSTATDDHTDKKADTDKKRDNNHDKDGTGKKG
jgi:hypothetical protein